MTFSEGDMLFYNSNGCFAELPAGSDGQVLKMVGGVPTWQEDATGAWTLLSTHEVTTADDEINAFTNVFAANSGYGWYRLVVFDLKGSNDLRLQVSTDGTNPETGSYYSRVRHLGYINGGSSMSADGERAASHLDIGTINTASTEDVCYFTMDFMNPLGSTTFQTGKYELGLYAATYSYWMTAWWSWRPMDSGPDPQAITGFKLFTDSSNTISSGKFLVYGVKS